MYDYKFRHSEISSAKPKRTWYKTLLLLVGLALAAGVLYGIIYLVGLTTRQNGSEGPETDVDAIPLQLPPPVESENSTRPGDSDS